MNIVTILVIAVVLWFVYGLLESYRNIEKELREIRLKCMIEPDPSRSDPIDSMKNVMVDRLSRLKNSI